MSAVHRNLIGRHTEWTVSHIPNKNQYKDGEVITLDLEPKLWQLYVRWLYGKPISPRESFSPFLIPDKYFCRLLSMYEMGEEVQHVLFQDEIMDLMIHQLEQDGASINLDNIVPHCLALTSPVSKARHLLVDFIVFGDQASCSKEIRTFFNGVDDQEFKSELALASLERVTDQR